MSFVPRRTTERRSREQSKVIGQRLLGVVSTEDLVFGLSVGIQGELFT